MNSRHLTAALLLALGSLSAQASELVDLSEHVPDAVLEIRYFGQNNFVGEAIDGYRRPACLLTEAAASALAGVQQELQAEGLGIKVFDCYRPQMAVTHFVRWARDLEDLRMKAAYYPQVDKANLFRDGYIAERSGHSRGSTIDLTLVRFENGQAVELDMGTGFDFFDPLSHTDSPHIDDTQRTHRLLLRDTMQRHGFVNLPEEWWHYTLANEPFPDTYFDKPVE